MVKRIFHNSPRLGERKHTSCIDTCTIVLVWGLPVCVLYLIIVIISQAAKYIHKWSKGRIVACTWIYFGGVLRCRQNTGTNIRTSLYTTRNNDQCKRNNFWLGNNWFRSWYKLICPFDLDLWVFSTLLWIIIEWRELRREIETCFPCEKTVWPWSLSLIYYRWTLTQGILIQHILT